MEVSKDNSKDRAAVKSEDKFEATSELYGRELITAVVSLSGLPEDAAIRDLETVIDSSGGRYDQLTMEQLRKAMLLYLEHVHEELSADSAVD